MTTYAFPFNPSWRPDRFELRIVPNTRVFVGPYTPTTQVIDLLGERWFVSFDMPGRVDSLLGAAFEAFFDRLKGPANSFSLWNLKFPAPQGTMRATDSQTVLVQNSSLATVTVQNSSLATVTVVTGTPQFISPVAQGANTATLGALPGKTLRAGDMLGIGSQTVRIMADATSDGSGNMAIEFQPRTRSAIASYTQVVTDKPTMNFILKADGVPVTWRPGYFEGVSVEGVEAI